MANIKSFKSLGVLDILLVLFVALKVLGIAPVTAWSWAVVLIPLWIQLGIFLLVLFLAIIAAVLGSK